MRYVGNIENYIESYEKKIKNPLIWLIEGIHETMAIPFYLLNWLNLISISFVKKIISNLVFKIVALISFISAIVTIITGGELFFEKILNFF